MESAGFPRLVKLLVTIQGIYYLLTGVWPLVHMSSFVMVTGPKTDVWLVKMVGLLAACIGICLVFSILKKQFPPLLFVLAITSAVAFLAVDSFYAFSGMISEVYLGDAVFQLAIVLAYVVALTQRTRDS